MIVEHVSDLVGKGIFLKKVELAMYRGPNPRRADDPSEHPRYD
ncbi:MAG: hypothetical protein WBX02_10630 [Terriglobales bacterium]